MIFDGHYFCGLTGDVGYSFSAQRARDFDTGPYPSQARAFSRDFLHSLARLLERVAWELVLPLRSH